MRFRLQLCLSIQFIMEDRFHAWFYESTRLVFERLFGDASSTLDHKNQLKRRTLNKSILDFALDGVLTNTWENDQEKLNEYFSSIRELEQRLEREEKIDQRPSLKSPDGIPGNYKEHISIMFDMALAFQAILPE